MQRRSAVDLAAEHADLDRVVARLEPTDWDRPTPADGWSVRDQISHLGYFDHAGAHGGRPLAFARADKAVAGGVGPSVETGPDDDAAELLSWWRDGRRMLLPRSSLDPSTPDPVVRPADEARSFVTARLMETWAHGRTSSTRSASTRPDRAAASRRSHRRGRGRSATPPSRGPPMPTRWPSVLTGPDGDDGRGATESDRRRPGRRSTSASWSPSGATSTTPTSSSRGELADEWIEHRSGVRRPSRDRAGPGSSGRIADPLEQLGRGEPGAPLSARRCAVAERAELFRRPPASSTRTGSRAPPARRACVDERR